MQIKTAMLENKSIPTELYKEEENLKKELALNDDNNIIPRSLMDDEYSSASYREP